VVLIGLLIYIIVGRLLRSVIKSSVYSGKQTSAQLTDAKKRETTLIRLFNVMWKIAVIFITGAVFIRSVFPSVNLGPLFASAGILSVAVAFGSQSIVKDLMTGIFIISENQYRVGDVVDINGAVGTVKQISVRSTVLRDEDGNVHYIPNGTIQHVINKTMGYSIARLTISVDPSTDISQLSEIIDSVGTKMIESDKWKPKIIEAPTFTRIEEITGASIKVVVTGKTQASEQWAVTAEIRRRLLVDLEKAKIKLAK
jgi:small conductance mechanosensitive channel